MRIGTNLGKGNIENMAWRCSSSSNAGLIDNLVAGKIITNPGVAEAMKKVDRANYAPREPYQGNGATTKYLVSDT
jgi:protein-L-isoaspartate(D-aspartate) O-methyltransferase